MNRLETALLVGLVAVGCGENTGSPPPPNPSVTAPSLERDEWYKSTDFGRISVRKELHCEERPLDEVIVIGSRMFFKHRANGHAKITALDIDREAAVGSIDIGEGHPFDLVRTPDGTLLLAVVCRFAGSEAAGVNRLDVIEAETLTKSGTVRLPGRMASKATVSADGKTAYVTDRGSHVVSVIDLDTLTVQRTISTTTGPFRVVLNESVNQGYVLCTRTNARVRVTVFQIDTGERTGEITTGLNTGGGGYLKLSPDGRRLYANSFNDSRLSVIDCDPESDSFHTELVSVETPATLIRGFVLNRAGNLALLSGRETGLLYLADLNPASPQFGTVVQQTPICSDAGDIWGFTEDGRLGVYVANSLNRMICVLDVEE